MKEKTENKTTHKTKIGGQALFEGVMMKGSGKEAMAVRKKDGSIHVEVNEVPNNKWYQKTIFIRGIFNFVLQMKNGYKYLMKSMEVSGFLDDEEDKKKEESADPAADVTAQEATPTASSVFGIVTDIPDTVAVPESAVLATNAENIGRQVTAEPGEAGTPPRVSSVETLIGVLGMVGGVALSVFLFMYLPAWGFTMFSKLFKSDIKMYQALFEGVIRIILFVAYMWAVSLMKEIRLTYEYHGAEHKTIAAYEAGEKLDPENVENIKKYTRFHPRCGTSFMFLMLAISILFFSVLQFFLPISSEEVAQGLGVNMLLANLIRSGVKIACLPVLVSISYEIIKLAGRYDRNIIMRIVSAPGIGMQRLTTKEPSEKQLEVAVAAMIPVIPDNIDDEKW